MSAWSLKMIHGLVILIPNKKIICFMVHQCICIRHYFFFIYISPLALPFVLLLRLSEIEIIKVHVHHRFIFFFR